MSNALESWSWNGCEGRTAKVEVYARAHHVSLYVNGKCVGTNEMKKNCITTFRTTYEPGELKAVSFNAENKKIAECVLHTAGDETMLTLESEQTSVKENDLLYVRMKYTDNEGTVKPLACGEIRVKAQGGRILGIGSACPFCEKSYIGDTADTYYGEALVIIQPEKGRKIVVEAESPYGNAETEVKKVK